MLEAAARPAVPAASVAAPNFHQAMPPAAPSTAGAACSSGVARDKRQQQEKRRGGVPRLLGPRHSTCPRRRQPYPNWRYQTGTWYLLLRSLRPPLPYLREQPRCTLQHRESMPCAPLLRSLAAT